MCNNVECITAVEEYRFGSKRISFLFRGLVGRGCTSQFSPPTLSAFQLPLPRSFLAFVSTTSLHFVPDSRRRQKSTSNHISLGSWGGSEREREPGPVELSLPSGQATTPRCFLGREPSRNENILGLRSIPTFSPPSRSCPQTSENK